MCTKVKVELYHFYTSKEFGMFLVRHFSPNKLFLSIITSYGEPRKAGYTRFDGSFHPDYECTEIDQGTFVKEYNKHVKDTNLVFLFGNTSSSEAIEGRSIRAVCQETKSHYLY